MSESKVVDSLSDKENISEDQMVEIITAESGPVIAPPPAEQLIDKQTPVTKEEAKAKLRDIEQNPINPDEVVKGLISNTAGLDQVSKNIRDVVDRNVRNLRSAKQEMMDILGDDSLENSKESDEQSL